MKNNLETGMTRGTLTYLGEYRINEEKRVSNNKEVYCQCECGNKKWVLYYRFINGKYKNCSCTRGSKQVRLGDVYVDLTVIGEPFKEVKYVDGFKTTATVAPCVCSCGNHKNVRVSSLVRGTTHSCGCKRSHVKSKRDRTLSVGTKVGEWEVISEPIKVPIQVGSNRYKYKYLCRCSCGVEKYIRRHSLMQKITSSCGCKESSKNKVDQ